MADKTLYEIEETRYTPRETVRLDFKGSLEEAKEKADELARKNIGVRYSVFREGGFVAEHQAYFRTTVTCPNCREIIPIG